MLGILFLLLTLVPFSTEFPLALLAAIGLALIWKWKLHGCAFAYLSLTIYLIVIHGKSELLMASSISLSWLITALSLQASQDREKEKLSQLHEELKKLQSSKEEEALHSAQVFFQETTALQEQIEQMKKELTLWQARFDESEEIICRQREELNELRVEAYQLSLLSDQPQVTKIVEVIKIDPRDIQLRKQFEEKNQVLHETRKSLFYTENALLALQKEHELSTLDEQETGTIKDLSLIEQERKELELEIKELEELISFLMTPKRATKPKKQELLQSSFF